MEPVPAFRGKRVAAQLVVAGDAPHIGGDAVALRQDGLRADGFVQDRAAAEQLRHGLALFGGLVTIDALEDALGIDSLGHGRHGVVLVVQGDVVEAVLHLFVHAPDAFYGHVRSFDNRYYRKAACVGKVGFRKPYHLDEFLFIKQEAKRRVKVPITGPYTIAEWSFNEYYQRELAGQYAELRKLKFEAKREFVRDVGKEIIRPNVEALVDAGAEWIQVDEPALTTKAEEVPFFVEAYNECTAGIDCKFSLHVCFSDYSLLYPYVLDLKNCNQYALEFANRDNQKHEAYNQLKLLNEYGDKREIGLGVVDVHMNEVETPEIVRDRILYATKLLGDPRRVYVNPDCGLRTRTWDVAYAKLSSITKGAGLARESFPK